MTAKHTILVVEDEVPIRTMVRYALEKSGFIVKEAEDAAHAEQVISEQCPDLLLLDWMLPNLSGIEFTRRLKKNISTQHIPIILLTAKAEEDNKVMGLESGADDYVVKPFSPRELVARIRAVLRRGGSDNNHDGDLLQVRDLVIDTKSQRCTLDGKSVKLGPLEFRLLCFFLRHRDRVYSRDELLSYVWGEHAYIDERTVDVHIRRLRRNLTHKNHHKLIQTVHGSGYRFSEKDNDK
jgi:two-component system phosphate regulon response regulator PhoB